MQNPQFQRTVEDFTCTHCGHTVQGDGYTNHCPRCLWSKHVDVNPGDRAETCGGEMEPVAVEGTSPEYTLVHKCLRCGTKRRNKVQADDDKTTVVAIAKNRSMKDTGSV